MDHTLPTNIHPDEKTSSLSPQDYVAQKRYGTHTTGGRKPPAKMLFRLQTQLDGSLAIVFLSEEFRSAHGFADELPSLSDVLAVLHPDDANNFSCSFAASADANAPWLHEYRIITREGKLVWFSGSAIPSQRIPGRADWDGFVVDITERKLLEERSRFLTERNRLLMRTATDGLHILDGSGTVVEASDNFARLLGYVSTEMRGMHVSTWDEKWNIEGRWKKFHGTAGSSKVYEALYRRKNGLYLPVEVHSSTASFDGGLYISSSAHDISGRKRDENELRTVAAAFEAKQCMFITDAVRRVVKVNTTFSQQTGFEPSEAMGKVPPMFRSALYDEAYFKNIWKEAREKGFWHGELLNRRKDDSIYSARVSITAVNRADGTISSYVGTEVDITAEKEEEKRITQLAYYDALTGLPNRRLLRERLHHSVAISRRTGSLGALLFIDLDNFKQLNDLAGHDVGDMLLVQVAQRLAEGLRDADTVARLGGDEFVVVLENLTNLPLEAAHRAEAIGSKILAALNEPFDLAGNEHLCTPSIGYALFGERDETVEELIKRADLAMYHAKAMGRNGIQFFDLEMRRSLRDRTARIDDIKRGIRDGEFELHYQPQISAKGQIFGTEALARWMHPTRGIIMPSEFVPLAEEVGLIVELGQNLLYIACTQLETWSHVPQLADTSISVNVSARQFRQKDFVQHVLDTIASTGANPTNLILEVTESVLMDNIDDTIMTMNALKYCGIQFALDDFGIGYSSLSYLKQLPFDQLKIDRAFVCDILTNYKDAAITSTIISLGRNLSLDVVAEGVESDDQLQCLLGLGCNAFQGYLISKALTPNQYISFVLAHHAGAKYIS